MCAITDGVILGFTLVCALFDLKIREIPVWIMALFSISVVIGSLICGCEAIGSRIAGLIMGIFFLFLSKWTKEAIGYGDSWLITLLGIYLGVEKLLWVLFIASFLAAIASLYQMWRQNWNRNGSLPFVPFLSMGAVGVILL